MLLKAGAKPGLSGIYNRTALAFAARDGHTAIVALLLENGANRKLRDKQGKSALVYAQAWNRKKIVRLLRQPH